MPNARNRIKASGDTHLPEVADDFDVRGPHPEATGDEGTQDRDRGEDAGDGSPRSAKKSPKSKGRDKAGSDS